MAYRVILLAFLPVFLFGQNVNLDKVNAKQSITLRGNRIDSFSIDRTFASPSNNEVATQKAVYDYISGIVSGLAYLPITGGSLTGTGGTGFIGFPAQSSAPTAPDGGFRMFANSAGNMGVVRPDGYITTFDFSTATANRFFTYPANAGTFGILQNTQTWSGATNTFLNSNIVLANGTSSQNLTLFNSSGTLVLSQSGGVAGFTLQGNGNTIDLGTSGLPEYKLRGVNALKYINSTNLMVGGGFGYTYVQPTGTGGPGFEIVTTAKFAINAPKMTDAQVTALTGQVSGGWVYSTTQNRPFVHNGTDFQGVVLGPQAGFSANQISRGGTGGNLVSDANLTFNGSVFFVNGGLEVRPYSSDLSYRLYTRQINSDGRFGLFLNTGSEQSVFQWRDAAGLTLGPPSGIDNSGVQGGINLQSGGVAIANLRISGRASSGSQNYSFLNIAPSATNERTEGNSYPSGSNFYSINTFLQNPTTSTNTGQNAVRARLIVGGRNLFLNSEEGIQIGQTDPGSNLSVSSAELNISSTNRGFLPPRLSSSSSIGYGIGSVSISNGGSGYGTGTGVVVTFSGGGGAGAAISLTYSGGVITGATILLKGRGYTTAPTITISGGTGSGAVLTCTLEATPNGLGFYNTTANRNTTYRGSFFSNHAYLEDILRDSTYKTVNSNLNLSGLTTTFKTRFHTVRIKTVVTAAASGNNTITMPVPSVDLLGISFKVSVEDTSGDSDISVISFGTDGADGYLYNGDGTFSSSLNAFPGIGIYMSVAWCEAKGAYRWELQ